MEANDFSSLLHMNHFYFPDVNIQGLVMLPKLYIFTLIPWLQKWPQIFPVPVSTSFTSQLRSISHWLVELKSLPLSLHWNSDLLWTVPHRYASSEPKPHEVLPHIYLFSTAISTSPDLPVLWWETEWSKDEPCQLKASQTSWFPANLRADCSHMSEPNWDQGTHEAEHSSNCWHAEYKPHNSFSFNPLSFGAFGMQQKLTDVFILYFHHFICWNSDSPLINSHYKPHSDLVD